MEGRHHRTYRKICPIELVMAVQGEGWRRGASEFAALGLWALAFYALLSLVSHDARYDPNFGGALGDGLARTLERTFGYQAYALVPLLACLGRAVWAATPLRLLLRYTAGGAILLVALSTAGGLCNIPMVSPGGATGAVIAAALPGNFSGANLIVLLAIGGALALLAGRAPTEIAVSSNVAPVRSRPSSGAKGRDDSMLRRVPEVNPASSLGGSRDDASGPPRTLESPLIVLAEKALPRRRRVKGAYRLPRLDLLDTPPLQKAKVDEAALERSARVLEQKLAGFGVQGQVVEVQPGPVVTMYKLEPGEGVKVSQIANLADDLSLALRAASVRILAPIPGEAVVGIEVPNRKRETVYLRELLAAGEFKAAASQLTIALGKDVAGCPVWADLAAMPHLLIAGATGTGKSVSIHAMVASILFKATADDVRFILIDHKMLELSVYDGIPHLLVPVVVDLEKAAAALQWATGEMEARYRVMHELGVRNIDSYNRTIGQSKTPLELRRGALIEHAGTGEQAGDGSIKHRRLPKIVIVIDELADLLLSQGKTVERDITRLAQQARAAGIHLMLATQRPSVDVVTGLIKANLPARISLQVTSRVDSRTILDSIGAERLLGAGDMLFMPPGTAKLRRLHGPFVSETEIRKICDFLRAQGSPDYQMEILESSATGEDDSSHSADQRDELYDEALRIVLDSGQASISMIQPGSESGTTARPGWLSRWNGKGSSRQPMAHGHVRCGCGPICPWIRAV
jgi:DNA segregation ATPase FtsK/SpoIIIE, S-DNA-T family